MVYYDVLEWVLGLGLGYHPSVQRFETSHDLFLSSEESPALRMEVELKQVGSAGIW